MTVTPEKFTEEVNSVTISYGEASAEQEVTVNTTPLELGYIEITSLKDTYYVGQYIDTSSLEITLHYVGSDRTDVIAYNETDFALSLTGPLQETDIVLEVSYTLGEVTKTAQKTINVVPKQEQADAIYIKDGGTGDGSSPEKALKANAVYPYNPDKVQRYYENTALYQAVGKLKNTGGTIVICGEVSIGKEQSYGSGSANREFRFPQNGPNTIKITSYYDGVDYRKTNNAKLIVEAPAQIQMYGQSVWENIEISTNGKESAIICQNYTTFFGDGIECTTTDSKLATAENAPFFIGIAGSNRFSPDKSAVNTNITVMSGTYNKIAGGLWGFSSREPLYLFEGDTNVIIGGSTTVLGSVIGSGNETNTYHEGNANITILGGTFYGTIEGTNKIGFNNSDALVNIIICGGDFTNCTGIYGGNSEEVTYNQPYSAIIDFSYYSPREYKAVSSDLSKLYRSNERE